MHLIANLLNVSLLDVYLLNKFLEPTLAKIGCKTTKTISEARIYW